MSVRVVKPGDVEGRQTAARDKWVATVERTTSLELGVRGDALHPATLERWWPRASKETW
jgi:hypothetical protein